MQPEVVLVQQVKQVLVSCRTHSAGCTDHTHLHLHTDHHTLAVQAVWKEEEEEVTAGEAAGVAEAGVAAVAGKEEVAGKRGRSTRLKGR